MDPLAELARQIPGGGDPVETWTSIERRTGALRRRRRLLIGGGLAVVLLAAIGSLVLLADGDDGAVDVVTTTPATTEPPVTTPTPATTAPPPVTTDAALDVESCGAGLPVSGDVATEAQAVAVVQRLLTFRLGLSTTEEAGVLAACLAELGLGVLPEVLAVTDVSPFGSTGAEQIVTVLIETPDGPVREEHLVAVIDGRGVVIEVRPREPSNVREVDARNALATFLDALAVEEWDVAASLLINEGAGQRVLDRIPDLLERGGEAVAELCSGPALCGTTFEILDVIEVQPFTLTFSVRFDLRDGGTTVAMPVGAFEGQLTVGELPPVSPRAADEPVPPRPAIERLLGGPPDADAVVERFGWVETPDGWFRIPFGVSGISSVEAGQALGRRADGQWVSWPIEDPGAGAELDTGEATFVLGLVDDGGEPAVAVGTEDSRLRLLDLDGTTRREVDVPRPDAEWSLTSVDTDGDVWLVGTGVGDSVSITATDRSGAPIGPAAEVWQPGLLSPDGTTMAHTSGETAAAAVSATELVIRSVPDLAVLRRISLPEVENALIGGVSAHLGSHVLVRVGAVGSGTETGTLVVDLRTGDTTSFGAPVTAFPLDDG